MEDKEKEPTRNMMYYPVMYYNNSGDMSSSSMGNNARGNGRGYSDGRYYYPERHL